MSQFKERRLERRDISAQISLGEEEKFLVGYICRYNTESDLRFDRRVCPTPFVEVIAPGAFARTLRENQDIPALFNHQTSSILGRTSAGTLCLYEDEIGLAFRVELPDTTLGHDVREMVRRGDIWGCSFGMYTLDDWATLEVRPDLPVLRTVFDLDLFEVTPCCTSPAYISSEVSLREAQRDASFSLSPQVLAACLLLSMDDD